VFVGRLSPEKNLEALLVAVQPLQVRLSIIGSGPSGPTLQARFGDLDGRLRWLGRLPNAQLPEILNRAGLFVLPSLHEGQPKALLEAMACGLAVLGASSPGIRDLIRHGENGWLCGSAPQSIRQAVLDLTSDPALCQRLGRGARQEILEKFSLDGVVRTELALLEEVTRSWMWKLR
jgi:glycosyltransferase involved in cell wall biosynthesis